MAAPAVAMPCAHWCSLPACMPLPPWPRRFRHRPTSLPPSAQASPRPCSTPWPCRRAASGATGASSRGRGPSTSPASRAASPRAPTPALACSRRCAPRRTRASTRAWARSTSATTSTASPARATCWTRTATSPSPPRS
jgi:hypothetical protein